MKAVIFDLDGTLVDSRASILASIDYAFDKLGYAGVEYDREKAVRQDLRATVRETGERLKIQFSASSTEDFVKIYREHHSRDPEATMSIYLGIPQMLVNLRKYFSVAVATTKHTEQAKHILKKLKLAHFFDHIQGTDPGMKYKPSPEILNISLNALGCMGMPAAYVGDSSHDMEAAKAASMKAIGVAYGFGGREHLAAVDPHHIVESVTELESLLFTQRVK